MTNTTQHDLRARMGQKRIGINSSGCPYRSPAQSDVARVTFSEWFRLLSDKTQVHGLSGLTITRSRLTHSLEVARIAESIGRAVVHGLPGNDPELIDDVGATLHAAALLHDIGNPPFGHGGEDDVSRFFRHHPQGKSLIATLPPEWRAQFRHFEGNAQALRYALHLGGWNDSGSMGLTSATISAFCKYPWSADPMVALDADKCKYGISVNDLTAYADIAEDCGTASDGQNRWKRHPLAYISEAADDIAYGVADLEDAVRMGLATIEEAQDMLFPLLSREQIAQARHIDDHRRRMMYIRGESISVLIDQVVHHCLDNMESLMSGNLRFDIVRSQIEGAPQMRRTAKFARDHIYTNPGRVEQDNISTRVITRAMEILSGELLKRERSGTPIRSTALNNANLHHASFNRIEWLLELGDTITAQTDRSMIDLADSL